MSEFELQELTAAEEASPKMRPAEASGGCVFQFTIAFAVYSGVRVFCDGYVWKYTCAGSFEFTD